MLPESLGNSKRKRVLVRHYRDLMSVDTIGLEQLTGGRPLNTKSLRGEPFHGVSTDSRTVRSGELFFALRGDRFDGHDFVKQAFDRGAAAAVVEIPWLDHHGRAFGKLPFVGVPNSLKALAELARIHRRNYDLPVIAVAGSNGKTTTKDLIASVLSPRGSVLKTEGTLNNHIGVPQTLFHLESTHRTAVIELGMNHLGEIATLCEIAEPTHGLITNIGREHLEFLHSLDNVARAEAELFDWLAQSDGIGFINADDPRIVSRGKQVKRQWQYGFNFKEADVRGTDAGLDANGRGLLKVECPAKKQMFQARLGLVGRHHLQNGLAAAAVGMYFGVEPSSIRSSLEAQKPAKHRMEAFAVAGVTVLDDTYNANPDSMLAALKTLAAFSGSGRRIAVLGDMGELGSQGEALHREIGETLRQLGIDALFTIGDLGHFIHLAAGPSLGGHSKNCAELIAQLANFVRPGDVVLLKASRRIQLERVVEGLKTTLSQ